MFTRVSVYNAVGGLGAVQRGQHGLADGLEQLLWTQVGPPHPLADPEHGLVARPGHGGRGASLTRITKGTCGRNTWSECLGGMNVLTGQKPGKQKRCRGGF